MRVVLVFLVWLFNFHTWKDFLLGLWVRWSPPSPPASGTEVEEEHLTSTGGEQESEFLRFVSSSPQDDRQCTSMSIDGDSSATIYFGQREFELLHGSDLHSGYGVFLQAVASSKVVFCGKLSVILLGEASCQYLEAFGEALRQCANDLRELRIDCNHGSAIRYAKCISSVVLGNESIRDLHLEFWSVEGPIGEVEVVEFMAIIASSNNLRILKSLLIHDTELNGEGLEELLKPFRSPHSVLEYFEFHPLTSDDQLQHISGMLDTNTSLKQLDIGHAGKEVFARGYTNLATSLRSNQSLKVLTCRISSCEELKALLDPLFPIKNNVQCNTTLNELNLWGSIGGKEGIRILVQMLQTNSSLLTLCLLKLKELQEIHPQGIENVLEILKALKINKCLRKIDFSLCSAIGGDKVLGAMMDLLLENHCIEDIGLDLTNLQKSGDVEFVYSALSKRKEMKLWSIVKGMANVTPTSGRVFLCGEPYAGKTRLRMSMKQWQKDQETKEVQRNSNWRKRMKSKVQTTLKVSNDEVSLPRTRGIEIDNVLCDGVGITIWDMAGQTNYHSFHELVMPNLSTDGSCSIFLLINNPMKQSNPFEVCKLQKVKEELEYWLRFIASNTRRSHLYRPHVSIVMTHFDFWKDDLALVACIKVMVEELISQFKEVLAFDEDKVVFKVDGTNVTHAGGVFEFIKSHLKDLLGRLPKTIGACEDVKLCVAKWNANQSNPRLLKWKDFCDNLCKDIDDFDNVDLELSKQRKVFAAISLNDGGHIIYEEKGGVVITNPHWFCHDIIGQFLFECGNKNQKLEMLSPNGIISIHHVKLFVLPLIKDQGDVDEKFDDILNMMKKLNICYERDTTSIIIPSLLKNTPPSLGWSKHDESSNFKYIGRRLACKDGMKTMLTLGFFTRLQVSFFQMLPENDGQNTYQVFPEVIKFIYNGIEVILQFNDGDIDILLRSYQKEDKVLAFLEVGIIQYIKYRQEDPTLGCLGVRLIEYILRPECVEKLVSPKARKNQYVHVKDLELEVVRSGVGATHSWKPCEGLDSGFNKVSTLLGGLEWKNLLERRSNDLRKYYKEVRPLDCEVSRDCPSQYKVEKDDPSPPSLWQRSWNLFSRPSSVDVKLDTILKGQIEFSKEVLSKLEDIKQSIQSLEHGIENMQRELLHEVCSRMDDLLAFSKEIQEVQFPKAAYLCEMDNRKLLTRFVPGLDRIKIHLMCESRYGFHEVANQKGHVVHFGTIGTKRFLGMLVCGLKLATILTKIGAHVACGMGSMVPDFSDGCNFLALVLDTPGFLDYRIPKETLESFPSEEKKVSRISIDDDTMEAQEWLREVLEPQCQKPREFYETFKLQKVIYKKGSRSRAWICDNCKLEQRDELQ